MYLYHITLTLYIVHYTRYNTSSTVYNVYITVHTLYTSECHYKYNGLYFKQIVYIVDTLIMVWDSVNDVN